MTSERTNRLKWVIERVFKDEMKSDKAFLPVEILNLLFKHCLNAKIFHIVPKHEVSNEEAKLNRDFDHEYDDNGNKSFWTYIFACDSWITVDIVPSFQRIPSTCKYIVDISKQNSWNHKKNPQLPKIWQQNVFWIWAAFTK